jgi:hypothetical protein
VDFAKAKSIAARRKHGYFPSENPKNAVFRRAIDDRPYILKKIWFLDSLKRTNHRGSSVFQAVKKAVS